MATAPTDPTTTSADLEAIRRVALDYLEGYAHADPERHARAYHPECVKRRFVTDPESGVDELVVLSPRIMVDYAARAEVLDDCDVEVVVDDVVGDMASVRVYSCRWIDFLHVVRARGAWRLFHVTWQGRSTLAPSDAASGDDAG